MKNRKLKKKLSIVLTVTILFTNARMTTFATETELETKEAEQTIYEEQALEEVSDAESGEKQTSNTEIENIDEGRTKDACASTWESATEKDVCSEETKMILAEELSSIDSFTETISAEELVIEALTETTLAEELTIEALSEMETAGEMTEIPSFDAEEDATETEYETEYMENVLQLDFSSMIASGAYKENGNNIRWSIDGNGKLLVEGTGDFSESRGMERAPWYYSYRSEIITAEINVQGMTSASYMFYGCEKLTSLDLSKFDTSNVTDMCAMFCNCDGLTSLDLSGFDTSKVTNMSSMFEGCGLTSLDLSSFDTSKVTDMSFMFAGCGLASLDLSSFDTSKVTDMSFMFEGCGLTSLDLSGFDTGAVTNMSAMFRFCKELTNLDISGFDTSKVTDMYAMFQDCIRLTSLDLSSFDMSSINVKSDGASLMFHGTESLVELKTPYNVNPKLSIKFPTFWATPFLTGTWRDMEGNEYTTLPTGRSDSVLLLLYKADELSSISGNIVPITKTKVYDGYPYEPTIKVTVLIKGRKTILTEGIDYNVIYDTDASVGIHKIVVRGIGSYKGELTTDCVINKKSIKKLKVVAGGLTGSVTDDDLSGLPVYVYDGTRLLTQGTDYTLSNYKAVKTNTATVDVVGNGNYEGSVTVKFTVYEADAKIITPEDVALNKTTVPYTGKAIKDVKPTVTVNGMPLSPQYYKVQYQNNKDAGTAFVIVTGKGAYAGKVVKTFTIETVSNPMTATIPNKTYIYSGKLYKPIATVTVNGKKLAKNKDYIVSYKKNFHAGNAIVTVTGKGNYAGLCAETMFRIYPQEIKKASVKGTQNNLTLIYSKIKLVNGTDYEASYDEKTIKNGKIQVTLTGKGDFTGTVIKNVKMQ